MVGEEFRLVVAVRSQAGQVELEVGLTFVPCTLGSIVHKPHSRLNLSIYSRGRTNGYGTYRKQRMDQQCQREEQCHSTVHIE